MVKRKILRVANYLKEALEKTGIKVEKLIIFGSQAKGTAKIDSDIDIIIISKDFEGKDIFSRAEITGDAHWEVMQKVLVPLDIIALTSKEFEKGDSLIAEAAKEGEIIYF